MSTLPVIGPNRGLVFDMRITLGNVITIAFMSAAILIGWGQMSNQVKVLQDQQTQQQAVIDKQLTLIQSMQLTQAQQTVIIQELDRRLSIVEDINGLDGKKHHLP